MAIAGVEADVPKLIGKRLQRAGENGIGMKNLRADIGPGCPFVRATLPNRKGQAKVVLYIAQVRRLAGDRFGRVPGGPVVGTQRRMPYRWIIKRRQLAKGSVGIGTERPLPIGWITNGRRRSGRPCFPRFQGERSLRDGSSR